MRPVTAAFLSGSVLFATACTSPDTASMQAGLVKSGLTAAQATCYGNALSSAVDAEAFNKIAEHLANGEPLANALRRARRQYGSDFAEGLATVRSELDACMK